MSKGESTRTAIVSEALSLASELGLGGISIGALATKVGMSKSGLFAHFGSLERLQRSVLEEAARRFVDTVVLPALKRPRGEPRVQALFDNWIRWTESSFMPGGCIFMASAAEFDDQPGPVRDALVASQRDWLDTITTATRIAVKEGHFRAQLDVDQFAFEFYALANGHQVLHRLLEADHADKRVKRAFARLLEGARPPSA